MGKIKNAQVGEYMISCNEDGSIKVFKDYDNVKGALREISEQIGFEYDSTWTTRQWGNKLIDMINSNK